MLIKQQTTQMKIQFAGLPYVAINHSGSDLERGGQGLSKSVFFFIDICVLKLWILILKYIFKLSFLLFIYFKSILLTG